MSDTPKPPPEAQLQVDLDDATANGVYANLAILNHTSDEFVLDFVYLQPQQPRARVRARVITSPRHVKRLLRVMQENLARYEDRYGIIELGPEDGPKH
jgi:hypothetical protein